VYQILLALDRDQAVTCTTINFRVSQNFEKFVNISVPVRSSRRIGLYEISDRWRSSMTASVV
jgi:hypothetical protein